MIKQIFLVILFILMISNAFAIKINEVELNPVDGSSGKEWIELYNEDSNETNVSNWTINDSIKKRYTLPNGIIIQSKDYYVIELENAVLNNDGDLVMLYNNFGNKIDETFILDEKKNSSKTWQLCEGNWKFFNSTKGEKNFCEEEKNEDENSSIEKEEINKEPQEEIKEENKENNDSEEIVEKPNKKNAVSSVAEEVEQKSTELGVIKLNAKSIKSENNKENPEKSNYAIYGFVIFCFLLGLLFTFRRNRFNKNEFR